MPCHSARDAELRRRLADYYHAKCAGPSHGNVMLTFRCLPASSWTFDASRLNLMALDRLTSCLVRGNCVRGEEVVVLLASQSFGEEAAASRKRNIDANTKLLGDSGWMDGWRRCLVRVTAHIYSMLIIRAGA